MRLGLCLLALIALSAANDVPLFIWSAKPQYFQPARATTQQPISLKQFNTLYSNLLASHTQKPEVVVSFVFDELHGPDMFRDCSVHTGGHNFHKKAACSFVKQSLSKASSSFAAPHFHLTPAEPSVSEALVDLHTAKVPTARVFAAELDSTTASSSSLAGCDALLSSLHEEQHVFSDKKTDLVLVRLSADDHNVCMARVVDFVATATKGNFLTLLSADSSPAFEAESKQTVAPTLLATDFTTQASNKVATAVPYVYPGVTAMNSSAMWGIMIGFLFFFILWGGLSWVTAIETPPRFSSTTMQLAKEY